MFWDANDANTSSSAQLVSLVAELRRGAREWPALSGSFCRREPLSRAGFLLSSLPWHEFAYVRNALIFRPIWHSAKRIDTLICFIDMAAYGTYTQRGGRHSYVHRESRAWRGRTIQIGVPHADHGTIEPSSRGCPKSGNRVEWHGRRGS